MLGDRRAQNKSEYKTKKYAKNTLKQTSEKHMQNSGGTAALAKGKSAHKK